MMKKHTTETLRSILFNEMDSLVAGNTSEDRAIAVARLAGAIVSSSRLELEHSVSNMRPVSPVSLVA